ncbi:MAG: DUF4870 domain-containing protein [Planctomycetota bacterium]
MPDETQDNPDESPEAQANPETPPTPPAPAPAAADEATSFAGLSEEEKTMGMLCHLLGLLTGFVGPLILWLVKKDESRFIDDQGKEALNFQIMMIIGMFASGILMFVCIGYFTFLALFVIDVVFTIQGTLKAKEGIAYRYPLNLRLIT